MAAPGLDRGTELGLNSEQPQNYSPFGFPVNAGTVPRDCGGGRYQPGCSIWTPSASQACLGLAVQSSARLAPSTRSRHPSFCLRHRHANSPLGGSPKHMISAPHRRQAGIEGAGAGRHAPWCRGATFQDGSPRRRVGQTLEGNAGGLATPRPSSSPALPGGGGGGVGGVGSENHRGLCAVFMVACRTKWEGRATTTPPHSTPPPQGHSGRTCKGSRQIREVSLVLSLQALFLNEENTPSVRVTVFMCGMWPYLVFGVLILIQQRSAQPSPFSSAQQTSRHHSCHCPAPHNH